MTGLLNRRALDEHPQRALEATGSRTVTVVAVDINRLEEVHDTLATSPATGSSSPRPAP